MFPIMAGNSASTGYNLTRSLRFRASASAYLSRIMTAGTSVQKGTQSFWVKRGILATTMNVGMCAEAASYPSGGAFNVIQFTSSDTLIVQCYNGTSYDINLATTQVFRDPSAFYQIIVAWDTTQATAANRVTVSVNGTQVTAFTTATYPAQNTNLTGWGASNYYTIGADKNNSNVLVRFFDGYLAEFYYVDGQQLTPSSFGSTNATTGVWQPARYTGTYGTNGFYLPFTDNSALTTSSNVGLGKDFSGNGNYWTTNNISITAGVTYDSMTDVPTLTSATAANFATLNPLQLPSATLSNGNLTASGGSAFSISTIGMSSGKFYAEMTVTTVGGESSCGISQGGYTTQTGTAVGTTLNGGATAYGYLNDGSKFSNGVNPAYGSSYTSGDVIGIAFDATAGTLTFYKNNTSQGSAYTGLTSGPYFFAVEGRVGGGTNNVSINFGQQPFTYTPPTGFVALNTFNLPTSTIVKGNTVMDATLYTGNGSTQTITNAGAFKPDLVWVKGRSSSSQDHTLVDSVRGVSRRLRSNATTAEVLESGFNITAFNSTGFTAVDDTNGSYNVNGSVGGTFSGAGLYVGWQWQAGQGSTSSNTNGSITSTVSVNASAGFSVVTYTGTGANATVGHGLGVAPSLIICKARSTTGSWQTYHSALTGTTGIFLDLTSAAFASSVYWNNTNPTSSVFSIGTSSFVNVSGQTQVAYCWTPIAGFSAFGSYTGNGSSDGTFVYTGFRPKFVMIKRTDSAGYYWRIWDSSRATYNAGLPILYPNVSDAEDSVADVYDLLSNGFKLRTTTTGSNASGGTYIYMAYAENPLKNSLAR